MGDPTLSEAGHLETDDVVARVGRPDPFAQDGQDHTGDSLFADLELHLIGEQITIKSGPHPGTVKVGRTPNLVQHGSLWVPGGRGELADRGDAGWVAA
ncbi:hypothetical protein ABZU76_25950 [Amycolatopsis sp. NPDC005232]|uniref:hypothetical protein n=1 Tax=Amycolatopsis sp. NPDC005232 TaxID=3157027 RepID=UPI0033BF8584